MHITQGASIITCWKNKAQASKKTIAIRRRSQDKRPFEKSFSDAKIVTSNILLMKLKSSEYSELFNVDKFLNQPNFNGR
ncbi:hypothetical protein THOE12_60098 [Vibrio rotiferianus]|nr:hypothetical protein THOE12_60098 [Vibrio rotiferianus]